MTRILIRKVSHNSRIAPRITVNFPKKPPKTPVASASDSVGGVAFVIYRGHKSRSQRRGKGRSSPRAKFLSILGSVTDSKILLIRGGALGDFILTLPVLSALRHRFPQHRLEILGYPSVACLAVAAGLADDVTAIESPRFTGFFVRDGSRSAEVAAWFSGFDWVVSYLYDPQNIFRFNVARCSSAPFIVGPHRPHATLAVDSSKLLLRPLQGFGICTPDPRPHLPLPAAPPAPPPLALHPGSGSERKNWPEYRWA